MQTCFQGLHVFLKYDIFCFKRYEYWENTGYFSHKLYFIKKKNICKTYDVIICTNDKIEDFNINDFLIGKIQILKLKLLNIKIFLLIGKIFPNQVKKKKGKKGIK